MKIQRTIKKTQRIKKEKAKRQSRIIITLGRKQFETSQLTYNSTIKGTIVDGKGTYNRHIGKTSTRQYTKQG